MNGHVSLLEKKFFFSPLNARLLYRRQQIPDAI